MSHPGAVLITRIGLVIAVVLLALNSWNRPTSEPDFSQLIDSFVDSGFRFPESRQAMALLDARKILITTAINAQCARDLIEKLLILDERDPSKAIDLYIRTEGGWEADAFSIIDVMREIEAPVNVHGIGEVHSSGLMILAAGTGQRIVYTNTLLGFHCLDGDEDPLWLERYVRHWEKHSHQPTDWLERQDGDFIYFDAKDAIVHGFADTLRSSDAE